MTKIRTIARNTSLLFVSQVISIFLVFIYTVLIARYLGAEGYGILSFALAFSGIFTILSDLGLSTLTVREVARNKSLASKYLNNSLLIKLILSIITFVLIILFINFLNYPQNIIIVVILVSSSVIINSIFGIFYSIFQAHEQIEFQSIGQIFQSILMFLGVLIAINLALNVVEFSTIYIFSSLVILTYVIIVYLWKFSFPKLEFDLKFWKITLKEALPFGLTEVSVTIYIYIDTVMLSFFKGEEVVGWYSAAYRLVLFFIFIPNTINITLFPSMSKLHLSDNDTLKFAVEKYLKLMLIIGIPIALATTILADKIILLLFGSGYEQSIIALRILIWTVVFIFVGSVFGRFLQSINRQVILTKISGITAIFSIFLNLILIPKYGLIGASISTVLTEIFLIIILFRINHHIGYGFSIKNSIFILIKIIIASFIMGLFLFYLININLIILLITSIFVYFATLYLIGGVNKDDINILKQIFNFRSK